MDKINIVTDKPENFYPIEGVRYGVYHIDIEKFLGDGVNQDTREMYNWTTGITSSLTEDLLREWETAVRLNKNKELTEIQKKHPLNAHLDQIRIIPLLIWGSKERRDIYYEPIFYKGFKLIN